MDYQTWRKVFPDSEEAAKSAYQQCTSTIDLLGTETAKVKQLEAKLAELQRDADRYRWLANNSDGNAQDDFIIRLNRELFSRKEFDEAIDAAIEGEKG